MELENNWALDTELEASASILGMMLNTLVCGLSVPRGRLRMTFGCMEWRIEFEIWREREG